MKPSDKIKFRGRSVKHGTWLIGDYVCNRDIDFICPRGIAPEGTTWHDLQVDPATIGQFTGLHDRNGKEIYEGDIIRDVVNHVGQHYQVVFSSGSFRKKTSTGCVDILPTSTYEIVGNIHDQKSEQ